MSFPMESDEAWRVLLVGVSVVAAFFLDIHYTASIALSLIQHIFGNQQELSAKRKRLQSLEKDLVIQQQDAEKLNTPATFREFALAERRVNELRNMIAEIQRDVARSEEKLEKNQLAKLAARAFKVHSLVSAIFVYLFWSYSVGKVPKETYILTWRLFKRVEWAPGSLHVVVWIWIVQRFLIRLQNVYKGTPS
jgi:hypothetical protein